MRYNFTIRIHKLEGAYTVLGTFSDVTISDITLVSKPNKFGGICKHLNNARKFGYKYSLSKPFCKISGSHTYPVLAFKGNYIDIKVENFPRFPAFYQDKYEARNILNGWKANMGNGFPICLAYRKVEFLNIEYLKL